MPAKSLNVALLGSKFMGRAHSNAWLQAPRFFPLDPAPVMHTVTGRNAAELATFAKRWGWANATTDWKAAVRNPEIDLVDIVVPNHMHREMALEALAAGKHVACEKPLAASLDDARMMAQAAKKARKQKTFVWYNYSRCPAVALARQIVEAGKLGRIFHVRAAFLQDWAGPDAPLIWRFRGNIAGSGSLGDLCAHCIDTARFITCDEFSEVHSAIMETFIKERFLPGETGAEISGKGGAKKGKKGKSTVDDAVLFLARMKGGAVASFEATRLSCGDKNVNRIEIHGEKGGLRFNFERMNELEWYDATLEGKLQGWSTIQASNGGAGHPYAGNWWPTAHVLGYENSFSNMAADIANVLAGKKPVVKLQDFADAYETQKVLHAVVESAKNRCAVKLSQIK